MDKTADGVQQMSLAHMLLPAVRGESAIAQDTPRNTCRRVRLHKWLPLPAE